MKEFSTKWFRFRAKGHENIKAFHEGTFEITKDDYLTPKGDCIIGIKSEISAVDLPRWLKEGLKFGGLLIVVLCSGDACDSVVGYGSPKMKLEDHRRMVFRKSTYLGPETVMIKASKAAKDLKRELVENLKKGLELEVLMTILDRTYGLKRNYE